MCVEAIYQFQNPIALAVQARASVEGEPDESEQRQLVSELRAQKTPNTARNASLGRPPWRCMRAGKVSEQ